MKLQRSLTRRTLVLGLTLAAAILPQTAHAQYSSPVRVTNSKTEAVPVKDQDNGARQPVVMHATVDFYDGSYYPHISQANMYTVPANKRLVLEYYTADIPAMAAQRVRVSVQTSSAGNPIALYFLPLGTPIPFDPAGQQTTSVGSGLIRIYCDPGATVHLNVTRNTNGGDTTMGDITLSGHLVDLLP